MAHVTGDQDVRPGTNRRGQDGDVLLGKLHVPELFRGYVRNRLASWYNRHRCGQRVKNGNRLETMDCKIAERFFNDVAVGHNRVRRRVHIVDQPPHRAVSALTADQIRAYRTMLVVDFFYAIAYTGLLIFLFRIFKTNQRFCGSIRRTGVAAALAAGLADYLENALILALLGALPEESPVAAVLGVTTTVKWIAVGVAVALLVIMAVLRDGPRRRRSP